MSKLSSIDSSTLASNPRATLSSWLRYEPIAKAAFLSHPIPYVYTPTSLSPSSVCSKLRDAVRGAIAFSYPGFCETPALARWWSEVVVSHDREKVFIGPPQRSLPAIDGSVHNDWAFCFDRLSEAEFSAFELLLNSGRIKGPVMIHHPLASFSLLPLCDNVERIHRADGKLVLL